MLYLYWYSRGSQEWRRRLLVDEGVVGMDSWFVDYSNRPMFLFALVRK
jgi:hypothetical protein